MKADRLLDRPWSMNEASPLAPPLPADCSRPDLRSDLSAKVTRSLRHHRRWAKAISCEEGANLGAAMAVMNQKNRICARSMARTAVPIFV